MSSASLLAGLGLLYIGIKGIAANLSQLAGRGLRVWIARSTGNYVTSALIGTLAGALTQSTSAVTVILMSLATADLITIPQAVPILVWANVGTSFLVLCGRGQHSSVRPLYDRRRRHLLLSQSRPFAALASPWSRRSFAISLLFLGLEFVRAGTDRDQRSRLDRGTRCVSRRIGTRPPSRSAFCSPSSCNRRRPSR